MTTKFGKLNLQLLKQGFLHSRHHLRIIASHGYVFSECHYSSANPVSASDGGNFTHEVHAGGTADDSYRFSESELQYFYQRRIYISNAVLQQLRYKNFKRKTPAESDRDFHDRNVTSESRHTSHVPIIVREMLKENLNVDIDMKVQESASAERRRSLKGRIERILQIQAMKYPFAQGNTSDCPGEASDAPEEVQQLTNVFGTPDPLSQPSDVTCSGCGSILHCQDSAIPGYIPSELFNSCNKRELHHTVCQRCTFLGHFDVALKVSVRPEDYVGVISKIENKRALVLLMVDLTDFPCSIWPGIVDVIGGSRRPLVVVANKVDLLPRSGRGYLDRVTASLMQSLKDCRIDRGTNIKHVCLISAKTGYGVEELISKLHSTWGTKGDIYLIGCTNVGKSSLFNALLSSDLCKTQAMDLIHRATISMWPGTTLNLLRFPILYPNPKRMYLRTSRLIKERSQLHELQKFRDYQLEQTGDLKFATLVGHIGTSFIEEVFRDKRPTPFRKPFDPTHNDYMNGKWLYDTPGVVLSDQMTNLLTLNELALTLPKSIINPQCVILKPGFTFFLAGLGRIDYIEGSESARLMVFCSNYLPLSVTPTETADEFYRKFLGTPVLKVPEGGSGRLRDFPDLVAKEITLTGVDENESCADIVLSSAGWCSVCLTRDSTSKFLAYTPGGHGTKVRIPALLPLAITLHGHRIPQTPFCRPSKVMVK